MLHNATNYKLFVPEEADPSLDDALDRFMTLNLMPVPWIEAQDITNAMMWLCSDEARFVTGSMLPVDAAATSRRSADHALPDLWPPRRATGVRVLPGHGELRHGLGAGADAGESRRISTGSPRRAARSSTPRTATSATPSPRTCWASFWQATGTTSSSRPSTRTAPAPTPGLRDREQQEEHDPVPGGEPAPAAHRLHRHLLGSFPRRDDAGRGDRDGLRRSGEGRQVSCMARCRTSPHGGSPGPRPSPSCAAGHRSPASSSNTAWRTGPRSGKRSRWPRAWAWRRPSTTRWAAGCSPASTVVTPRAG